MNTFRICVVGLGDRRAKGIVVLRAGQLAECASDVGHELRRHLGRREHVVHQPGGNGAARHAVVLGRFGILCHRHAAPAFDRPHSLRAVAARAGEHDADSAFMLVLCERAEEEVDRQAMTARRGRFQQVKRTVQKGHVAVGRNDVGAVGLDRHPVFNLEDLHAGIALDQVGENAFMVRGQVLHQDKSHAGLGLGRHAGKESLTRRQPARRRADADDRELRLWAGLRSCACCRLGFFRRIVSNSRFFVPPRRRHFFDGGACPFHHHLAPPSGITGARKRRSCRARLLLNVRIGLRRQLQRARRPLALIAFPQTGDKWQAERIG